MCEHCDGYLTARGAKLNGGGLTMHFPGPANPRCCFRIACTASIALYSAQAIGDCKFELRTELPVALTGLHPLIVVKIAGSDVPVVLDSGATFNLLSYDAAAKLHLRWQSLRGRAAVSSLGGAGHTLLALAVADVRLGAVRVADAKFIISGARIGSAAGFIGDGILRKFDVDYDLAGGVVKLGRASGCDGVPLADWAKSQPYSAADMDRDAVYRRSPGTSMVSRLESSSIQARARQFSTSALRLAQESRRNLPVSFQAAMCMASGEAT